MNKQQTIKVPNDRMFMLRAPDDYGPNSSGCRFAVGERGMVEAIGLTLGRLTSDSRATLSAMLEGSKDELMTLFRGRSSVSLYREDGNKRVDVFLVMSAHGV